MTSATIEPSAFPLQTLSSFGPRLNRLEFLLTGASRWDGVPIPPTPPQHDGNSQNSTNKFRPEDTIVSRLYELQRSLDQLKRKEEVQSILSICKLRPPTRQTSFEAKHENLSCTVPRPFIKL